MNKAKTKVATKPGRQPSQGLVEVVHATVSGNVYQMRSFSVRLSGSINVTQVNGDLTKGRTVGGDRTLWFRVIECL